MWRYCIRYGEAKLGLGVLVHNQSPGLLVLPMVYWPSGILGKILLGCRIGLKILEVLTGTCCMHFLGLGSLAGYKKKS